jgi:hypothetical protein
MAMPTRAAASNSASWRARTTRSSLGMK